jgi:hypothetical protein
MSSVVKVISGISNIQYLLTHSNSKKTSQVLDPLSCMIRLALLKYKPTGTKISICNNRIFFQAPTVFQGSLRWKNGDTRLDIHTLLTIIQKAIVWHDLKNEKIKYIYQSSKDGLIKLLECYNESSNTSHTLTYYIDIITKAITDDKPLEKKTTNDNDIYNEAFSKLWNDRKIDIIYNLFLEISESEKEEQEYLISAIESILAHKDIKVQEIVIEVSCSL